MKKICITKVLLLSLCFSNVAAVTSATIAELREHLLHPIRGMIQSVQWQNSEWTLEQVANKTSELLPSVVPTTTRKILLMWDEYCSKGDVPGCGLRKNALIVLRLTLMERVPHLATILSTGRFVPDRLIAEAMVNTFVGAIIEEIPRQIR